jgi:hypothetical protein
MNLIPPLANQSCSWANSWYASKDGITSLFECLTELPKSFASTGAQRSERLLLNSVSKDRNHQVPSQVGRWIGMEELLLEIAERRLAQCGQDGKTLFDRLRHTNLQPDIDASLALVVN